jgi:hypothetical protein
MLLNASFDTAAQRSTAQRMRYLVLPRTRQVSLLVR